MTERVVSAASGSDDVQFEAGLRPRRLDDYIGQDRVRENLEVSIAAARQRGEALDHILLWGPPGLGKTTLAYVIANEMGAPIRTTSGPVIEKPGDLAGMLSGLQQGEVLFIDEIHRMPATIEEILYPAMEDYELDIVIGQGPGARSVKVPVERFTLIGATTRAGLLTAPLRARFGINHRLDFYTVADIDEIVRRSARILNAPIDDAASIEIARRARGTPPRRLAGAANQDRNWPWRNGGHDDAREVEELPVVFHVLAGLQLADDLDAFVHALATRVEIDAHHVEFLLHPADAHAHVHASLGEVTQAAGRLGDLERVTQRQDVDVGAEMQLLGDGRQPADQRPGLGPQRVFAELGWLVVRRVQVLRVLLFRVHEMIRHQHPVKSHALRRPRDIEQLVAFAQER